MAKAQTTTSTKANNKAVPINYIEAGPRGFRFGYTYVQSVIDGEGIAAREVNRKKLIAFAKAIGVEGVTMKSDIAESLKAMKTAAKKYLKANFEVPAEPTMH